MLMVVLPHAFLKQRIAVNDFDEERMMDYLCAVQWLLGDRQFTWMHTGSKDAHIHDRFQKHPRILVQ